MNHPWNQPAIVNLGPSTAVWCLLIDRNHRATFGEPFPVYIRGDQTTHDLKIRITTRPGLPETRVDLPVSTNQIEIWKCKSLKLSSRDSFGRTKQKLCSFKFSEDDDSDAQHIGVSQMVRELALQDNELLLVLFFFFFFFFFLNQFIFRGNRPWTQTGHSTAL